MYPNPLFMPIYKIVEANSLSGLDQLFPLNQPMDKKGGNIQVKHRHNLKSEPTRKDGGGRKADSK